MSYDKLGKDKETILWLLKTTKQCNFALQNFLRS